MGDRQTESHAGGVRVGLAAVIRLEDGSPFGFRDAGPRVGDADFPPGRPGGGRCSDRDGDGAPLGSELHCIADEVD